MKILLVEDDPFWRMKIEMAINGLTGIEYMNAETIEEGLIQFKKFCPDLLICDIVFPDGIIFNKLLNWPKNQPIIFITGTADESFYKQSLQFVEAMFLVKPFHALSLISAIERFRLKLNKNQGLLIKGKYNHPLRLPFEEIIYLEANGNYTTIHLPNKKYSVKFTIKRLIEQLDSRFIQVHKSFIINIDFIQRVDISANVLFIDSLVLPIGRVHKKKFIDKISSKKIIPEL